MMIPMELRKEIRIQCILDQIVKLPFGVRGGNRKSGRNIIGAAHGVSCRNRQPHTLVGI